MIAYRRSECTDIVERSLSSGVAVVPASTHGNMQYQLRRASGRIHASTGWAKKKSLGEISITQPKINIFVSIF